MGYYEQIDPNLVSNFATYSNGGEVRSINTAEDPRSQGDAGEDNWVFVGLSRCTVDLAVVPLKWMNGAGLVERLRIPCLLRKSVSWFALKEMRMDVGKPIGCPHLGAFVSNQTRDFMPLQEARRVPPGESRRVGGADGRRLGFM